MGDPVKTQVENGLIKLFNFRGQNIDIFDQVVFTLNDSGLYDEEGNKINTSRPLTAVQRRSGRFVLLMMTVHPYQDDTKCKKSTTTCRDCIQLPLDVNGIYASINKQMLKTPHDLLFHLVDLENGRKPYIGTLKKEKGDIFSEYCTDSFKEKILIYVNEVLFEMVKTALKDKYLGTTTPTAPQNEVSIFR